MLELRFVREHSELVKAGALKKHVICDVERVLELDVERREGGRRVDELRSLQKSAGKKIASAQAHERQLLLAEQTALKVELKGLEERQRAVADELRVELLRVPNVPADDVPEGKDDSDNVELKRVGKPAQRDFEVRDHIQLASEQGWFDVEVGPRIAGSRNYVLLGDLALLERAVMNFAFEHMLDKGFTPLSVPMLVRRGPLEGTGYFPGGEEQTYRTDERDELYLAGTSEVPVTALHADSILQASELPKRYVAHTTCYRREAGTYGKDTRGLYRVHQFQKVEQVILGTADEQESIRQHSAILRNSEELLAAFELPYRVVNVCGGDLGVPHVQKFDIETWMPSREGYGETHSASRFYDYQARRLNLRYRGADGKVRFCHTLNNTVAASTRLLIALLENHQRTDGTIRIPAALQPFMRGREAIGRAL